MKELTPEDIVRIVTETTGVPLSVLITKNRKKDVVMTKQLCYYFICYCTKMTLDDMAMYVGGGEGHDTALHGKRMIERDIWAHDRHKMTIIDAIKYKMVSEGFSLPNFTEDEYDKRVLYNLGSNALVRRAG